MKWLLLLLIGVVSIRNAILAPEKKLLCTHLYNKVSHLTIEQPDPEAILDNDDEQHSDDKNSQQSKNAAPSIYETYDELGGVIHYEKCGGSNFCYALWQTENGPNGTIDVIMGQGCWAGNNGKQECDRSKCISDKKPPKAANNTKFCCCSGHLCNQNFTDAYIPSDDDLQDPKVLLPASEYLEQSRREHQKLIIIVACVCVLMAALGISVVVYRMWHIGLISSPNNKNQLDSVNLMEGGPRYTNGVYSVDHLKLVGRVGQGRYGSVWKGTVNEQEVAVKIFPAHYRNYFYNEQDIYCLPFMDNPCLLTYFGCDERTNMEGQTEYLLVLSYAPNGCLQDYLKENTLDWNTFCKMALTVAKGLAHLHTDIIKGDKVKPCVSHRDLNTRNVLVKNDLTCCLCDLGFAMKISNAKYFQNGEDPHQEPKSLSEVGTLRYMAPEVLEGAVNLLDCESSLKQIDVYALGLVLWELATRCTELFPPGIEVPPYKLPFENEVGSHPTFEQMQTVVSRRKARPLWPPEAWNGRWGCSPAHRLVRETTEDCWDQDAEARLTALCVEERLHELPHLKDRGNRGTIYTSTAVSPTINQTQISNPSVINNNHINTITSAPNITLHNFNQESTGGNSISISSIGKDASEISEGTIETVYTMTPSEPPSEHGYKNSNQTAQYIQQNLGTQIPVLQPFQGRNPCMERNLLISSNSTEDIQSQNTLIDKSFKHLSTYYNSETQGLIGHDYLNQNGGPPPSLVSSPPIISNGLNHHQNGTIVNLTTNRPATPIPYVQNVVYDNIPKPMPKTQNISGSSSALNDQQNSTKYGIFGWSGWRKLLDKKLFGREKLDSVLIEEPEVKSNLLSKEDLRQSAQKQPIIMETQVNLVTNKMVNGLSKQNGSVVTSILNTEQTVALEQNKSEQKRPSTLPLDKSDNTKYVLPKNNSHNILIHNESNPLSNQKFTIVPNPDLDNLKNNETDENAHLLSPLLTKQKISGISQVIKHRRKSLSREGSFEQFNEVFSSNTDLSRLKDPTQRIKTPGDVPPSVRRNRGRANSSNSARFSLYDDRMMSVNKYEDENCEQSWSNSVPDGIGVTINYTNNNNNNQKTPRGVVESLVIANRTDSVSSF
ncbi:bone morphogenetic protein receptor type-2 [Chrysoperla carnea]|uniref:bone morphogenetic protein receptor type-2 n=1 Tax=Chrysoperla carnea TaxID=189513 RepID=UPI001D079369|nr:bone morphogenetic protein receptor type-2 [Chrysoperla carnea]